MMNIIAGELEQIKAKHLIAVAKAKKELAHQKAIHATICVATQVAMAQVNVCIATMLNGVINDKF